MKKIILQIALAVISLSGFSQNFKIPETTEVWEPKPKLVVPGKTAGSAPSDAVMLFDGKSLDGWQHTKDNAPAKWTLKDGVMTAKNGTGEIRTKQEFGSFQIHVEFNMPLDAKKAGYPNGGNSGVFLHGRYEVQIFDSYNNEVPIYANGMAGSIYKQVIPAANAMLKPGEWNTYDIIFTAPKFRYNGSVETPAYVTVLMNGVMVLNHFEIQGTIQYIGIPSYEYYSGKGPIALQEHGSEVSFRNIWIREL
ncbi:3-keto-disaccharide hydrolase [Emticicia sp. 17c]|uniref:3-keto-disaccharide hydrolase n=1 Tax=Emticicia sp. 17c TaxID=3127704 RepID=UPI00301BF628